MILRKPYAILIKNFKLIHIILAILMGYIFYKTNMLLSFLTEYLSSVATTITHEVTTSLSGPLFVGTIILVIVVNIILLALMHFKDKPLKLYAYNLIYYIALSIFYFISLNAIKSLEVGLVDVRVLKILHDISVLALILQILALILVIVRATGFDIKNFDFKKDLEELNISSQDNEEFEVELEVDTDRIKRIFNKKIRHAKYIYLENKLLLNIIGCLLLAIISFIIYLNVGVYNKTFKLNEAFKTNQFIFNFTNSYSTKYDYKKVEIKKNYELIAVQFQIRTIYNKNITLKTGNFYLDIEGRKFYPVTKYKDRLFDLGTTYMNQEITNEFSKYLLTFEIPSDFSDKKMILKYYDTNNDIIKIDITPTSLNEEKNIKEVNLGENLLLEDSIIKDTSIVIENYELSSIFTIQYNYCTSENNCFESIEYLKSGTDYNIPTILLKLSGQVVNDSISKTSNLFDYLNYFGKIEYELSGEKKEMTIPFKKVKPKKTIINDLYIEVPSELENADKIDIKLNIRNKIYIYHLK